MKIKKILAAVIAVVMVVSVIPSGMVTAEASPYPFMIDDVGYASFTAAWNAVPHGGTITMMSDYTHNNTINIINRILTINLNGFKFNLNTSSLAGSAITVSTRFPATFRSEFITIDTSVNQTGEFNINSRDIHGNGVRAEDNAYVEIIGNITSAGDAIRAIRGAEIVVVGNINSGGAGIDANIDSIVFVAGDIFSGQDSMRTSPAIRASQKAEVILIGNIYSKRDGIEATSNANVLVIGDIVTFGMYDSGVFTRDSTVTVIGSIEGGTQSAGMNRMFGKGIHAIGESIVNVTGYVLGFVGVYAERRAVVNITGHVLGVVGVEAWNGSEITVYGTITTPTFGVYIGLDIVDRTKESGVSSASKPGYLEYRNGDDVVWVRCICNVCYSPCDEHICIICERFCYLHTCKECNKICNLTCCKECSIICGIICCSECGTGTGNIKCPAGCEICVPERCLLCNECIEDDCVCEDLEVETELENVTAKIHLGEETYDPADLSLSIEIIEIEGETVSDDANNFFKALITFFRSRTA
jgi:hypothetical protein